MPDTPHLAAFALAATVLALIPGPGMLYVLSRSIGGGREVGLRSSLGTMSGGCVHVVAAAAGLSALLAASALAFSVVRYAGAAYLIWLGVSAWLGSEEPPVLVAEAAVGVDRNAFRQGMLVEALNPKMALFFLTFLPQFCEPRNGPVALQLAVLGCFVVLLNALVDVSVSFAAGSVGRRLRGNARLWRRQRRATGTVLVGLGVYAASGR